MAKYKIIDHGVEHTQYFQGVSTAYTKYERCVTGIGSMAQEAYEDAVDQLYQIEDNFADVLNLPVSVPLGDDCVEKDDIEDWYYHVSILYDINEE